MQNIWATAYFIFIIFLNDDQIISIDENINQKLFERHNFAEHHASLAIHDSDTGHAFTLFESFNTQGLLRREFNFCRIAGLDVRGITF